MEGIFSFINDAFASVVPVADFLWDFPTNYEWYASIPILGRFSLLILLLLGGGLYFTLKLGFVQIRDFKTGFKLLMSKKEATIGESPVGAFLISMACRVGAGNIVGVTGAVTLGGPGAIFWMWISACLGMATAFSESTLAQLFKERRGNEYVGGFTFYVQKVWKNKKWVGFILCILYLIYNLLSIPAHTFHVFTGISSIVNDFSVKTTEINEPIYYVVAAAIIIIVAVLTFGGIKRAIKFSNKIVPFMAISFVAIVLLLIIINITKFPAFLSAVFVGAFKPAAIFGGAFGAALSNGLKRGLISNEAGMGTATQAASIADANHPCEQGFMQAIGVFIDTVIICTLTGFIITAGTIWENPAYDWESLKLDKIGTYVASVKELVPGDGAFDTVIVILFLLAFTIFAFTTLLCDMTYSEIAANKISSKKEFITLIRVLCALIFVPIGTITVLSGMGLDNLWYVSDLINALIVFINLPTLLVASKLVKKVYVDYKNSNGARFVSTNVGIETEAWSEEMKLEYERAEKKEEI